MSILVGGAVYGSQQLQQKSTLLSDENANLIMQSARMVYFLHLENTVSSAQRRRVQQLLSAEYMLDWGDFLTQVGVVAGNWQRGVGIGWVVPRLGTVSPWSSKATELLRHCGLHTVLRVECGRCYQFKSTVEIEVAQYKSLISSVMPIFMDSMTETFLLEPPTVQQIFATAQPKSGAKIPLLQQGMTALQRSNQALGLALSAAEMQYVMACFQRLQRNPTELELMLFAQVNSEHCRHKIFNANWIIDGKQQTQSLFQMIRTTHKKNPKGVLSAYVDNAAVLEGAMGDWWSADTKRGVYCSQRMALPLVIKVETHNHPSAVSPWPGAATGAGGEIRDEGATGRGARPKAGLVGFSVSDLCIPGYTHAWEHTRISKPPHLASALRIMLDGPLGAASFNNEFGRPNIAGYFRSYQLVQDRWQYGYYKPIVLAGGMGVIRPECVNKCAVPAGALLIVLGGPALLIGLGGGSASSAAVGKNDAALDFASVQRSKSRNAATLSAGH